MRYDFFCLHCGIMQSRLFSHVKNNKPNVVEDECTGCRGKHRLILTDGQLIGILRVIEERVR